MKLIINGVKDNNQVQPGLYLAEKSEIYWKKLPYFPPTEYQVFNEDLCQTLKIWEILASSNLNEHFQGTK